MFDRNKMIKVISSNVKAVDYQEGNLYVEYTNRLYVYKNVPKQLYEDLLKSESKGKYLNENIKGKFDYVAL